MNVPDRDARGRRRRRRRRCGRGARRDVSIGEGRVRVSVRVRRGDGRSERSVPSRVCRASAPRVCGRASAPRGKLARGASASLAPRRRRAPRFARVHETPPSDRERRSRARGRVPRRRRDDLRVAVQDGRVFRAGGGEVGVRGRREIRGTNRVARVRRHHGGLGTATRRRVAKLYRQSSAASSVRSRARGGRVALRRLRARGDRGDDDGAPVDPPTPADTSRRGPNVRRVPRRQKPGAVKRHRRSGGRGDDRRSNRLDRRARHRLLASVPREIFRREIPRRAILRRRRRGDVLHRRAASLVERKVRPQIRLASRRQRTAPRPNFHRRQRPGPEPDVVDRERRASGTAHRPEGHRHPRVRDRAAIRAVRV